MQDFKLCKKCGEVKQIEEFYNRDKNNNAKKQCYCKECTIENVRQKRLLEKEDEVLPNPNEYVSDEQKYDTIEVLTVLGWLWNDKLKLWYKPGIKNENGTWKFQIK